MKNEERKKELTSRDLQAIETKSRIIEVSKMLLQIIHLMVQLLGKFLRK